MHRLRAAIEGSPPPPPPKPVFGLPETPFTLEQAALLGTAAAAVAIVTFSSSLFGQLADPIAKTFGVSDATLGVGLAITRIGALFALPVTMLADRRGRRRSILFGVAASSVMCAVTAIAPTFAILTAAQVLQRGCVIATATVAAVAVIEEAPEGARAYAASMLALSAGFGFSFAVLALPVSDIAGDAWRIPYGLGALTILLAPNIARRLRETTRYEALALRTDVARGRVRELFTHRYGRRFVLLAIVGLMTNVFNAPSSQLMNKYLSDEHGFSGSGIALFRTVTTGIPGLLGVIIGGRLAEAHGRRPVAAIALALATLTQMVFFLGGGAVLWVASALSVIMAGAGGIALGTLDAELFPTEVRSTSNALLAVVSVTGSAIGLAAAGILSDHVGGLGNAIALCGIGAVLASVFLVPLLPESAAHELDEISPSEATEEYRPDP